MANVISISYICATGFETVVTMTTNLHWQVCYTRTQRPRWWLWLHQATWAKAEPTCWDTGKVAASPWPFRNLILHLFAPENHEDKQAACFGTCPTFREGQAGHTCGDSFLCDASNLSNNKHIVNQLALGDVTVHSVLTMVQGGSYLNTSME